MRSTYRWLTFVPAIALVACTSSRDLTTAPRNGPGSTPSASAPALAQCADVGGTRESFGETNCTGGGAGYACQSGTKCKRNVKGQITLLPREPDEISCSTATGLCVATFYGSGTQLFNPEESGFLFGAACFGACAGLAANRNVFAIPQCLTCFGLFARHWDLVADAQRAHYVLGMHVMSGRYIPHLGQGSEG
jgi:hypothetical protein